MIDLHIEQVFPLGEIGEHLPKRRGKKAHKSIGYRWAGPGLRGIKLESVKVGGIRYTSREALDRFFARLDGDDAVTASSTSKRREHEIAAAERELDQAGI